MQKIKWPQNLGLPNRSKNRTFFSGATIFVNKKVLHCGVMHCIEADP